MAGVFLQGLSPVITKLLLEEENLSQAAVVAGRYCLAAAVLLPFGLEGMRRTRIFMRPRTRDWVALILVGALGSGVGALLFTAAVDYTSAGLANAISKTAPIFVVFMATYALRERVPSLRFLLVAGMVGADVLIGLGELAQGGAELRLRLIGDALALGAGMTRGVSDIVAKSALNRFTASTVAFWRFGVGFVVAAAVMLGGHGLGGLLNLDLRGWALMVGLAGGATALSMYLYYRGMASIPAHVCVSVKLLGAVVTVVVSWFVLRESLNLYHIAGMGVLISGSYLLVLRTTREHEAAGAVAVSLDEADVAQEPPAARRVTPLAAMAGSLRWKIVVLVSAVIIATVASSTYLSVRHTQEVVREQARLTMIQVGTMVLQSAAVEDRPNPYFYQQYLERLVAYRIQSQRPLYVVDIVYIGLNDEGDNPIAFAYNPNIQLVDRDGRLLAIRNTSAARQLRDLGSDPAQARRYGIVAVDVMLQDEGHTRARVWMGCKSSIADSPATEIAARNAGLVLALLVLGIAVTVLFVARLTRPLERLSTAVGKLAGGERAAMLVSSGSDEVGRIARNLANLQEDLALGERWRQTLLRVLGPPGPVLELTAPAPFLAVEPSNGDARPLEELLEVIFQLDGEVVGAAACESGRKVIIAAWGVQGAEADDPLRAVLAAMQLRDLLAGAGRVTVAVWPGPELDVEAMAALHRIAHGEAPGAALMSVELRKILAEHFGAGAGAPGAEDANAEWCEVGELDQGDDMDMLARSTDQ